LFDYPQNLLLALNQYGNRGISHKTFYKTYLPGSFKSAYLECHRYPGITAGEIAARLARFQKELGDDDMLELH
jgi:hypothetical protein